MLNFVIAGGPKLSFRLMLILLPSILLSQVRYLLLGGANVVRCAALYGGPCI